MGKYYRESSYRNFLRFFKKRGFIIRNDGPHLVARHEDDPDLIFSVPRSTKISNGVTEELCKKLVELGYDEKDINKYILK